MLSTAGGLARVPFIKPMNRESITAIAKSVKGCVTAEEHSVIGGLGGAIAEAQYQEARDFRVM